MKTIRLSVFSTFDEYCADGVRYMLVDESMVSYYKEDRKDDFIYITDVEIPTTPRDEVLKMGAAKIDREIIDLQVQINQKEEKKKQLLAIEYTDKGKASE